MWKMCVSLPNDNRCVERVIFGSSLLKLFAPNGTFFQDSGTLLARCCHREK